MLGRTVAPPSEEAPAKAGPALKVTIVLDQDTAAMLDADRLALPDIDVRVHAGNLASFVASALLLRSTDVLILQLDPGNPREFEEFERFVSDNKDRMPVIAAVRELSVAITRRVLRSDAIDVLTIPFTPDELHQAIETGRHRVSLARPAERSRGGRVVSFLGALGGVGATAIASQAGMFWSDRQSVCLIDLDLQFGNAALYLNLRPQLSLGDLLEAGDRLDVEFLRSVAERHPSGLSAIASPPDMMPLDVLTPEFVDHLLDLAVQAYDVVLVDLPTAWIGWSLSALMKSNAICLVTGLSVPGIHQARRQLEVLDANGLSERVRIILNRVVNPMFGKADMSEAEKVLRRKVDFPIANDYPTVSAAIDEGRLLSAIKVKSRVEKDMRALVNDLAALVGAEKASDQ